MVKFENSLNWILLYNCKYTMIRLIFVIEYD